MKLRDLWDLSSYRRPYHVLNWLKLNDQNELASLLEPAKLADVSLMTPGIADEGAHDEPEGFYVSKSF